MEYPIDVVNGDEEICILNSHCTRGESDKNGATCSRWHNLTACSSFPEVGLGITF